MEEGQRNQEYLLPGGYGRLRGEGLEPKPKGWVEFKDRNVCEGSLQGKERKVRRSRDRHGTLSRPCWLEKG